MQKMLKLALVAGVAVALAAPPLAIAQDDIRKETVQFDKGQSGATVSGSITGDEAVDYMLRASAGQTMTVSLETDNGANYFNVLPPGSADAAMFIGSTSGNEFSGTLSESGEYAVRIYLMRSAARRNETANYTLDIGITGTASGAGAVAQHHDAKVAGTDYHATGQIPCARHAGQPMGQCHFGVERKGSGNGMITVFWPDGGNRVIFYEAGTPMSYDESAADGGAEMTVRREADLFMIRIGDQRFEIPKAAITGG